jgi:hypothetical protein
LPVGLKERLAVAGERAGNGLFGSVEEPVGVSSQPVDVAAVGRAAGGWFVVTGVTIRAWAFTLSHFEPPFLAPSRLSSKSDSESASLKSSSASALVNPRGSASVTVRVLGQPQRLRPTTTLISSQSA